MFFSFLYVRIRLQFIACLLVRLTSKGENRQHRYPWRQSVHADLQCCIETEKLESKVDALNDNAVILSKSLLSPSSSSSSSSLPHQLAQIKEKLCLYPHFGVLSCTGTAELSREDMRCAATVTKPHISWKPRECGAA